MKGLKILPLKEVFKMSSYKETEDILYDFFSVARLQIIATRLFVSRVCYSFSDDLSSNKMRAMSDIGWEILSIMRTKLVDAKQDNASTSEKKGLLDLFNSKPEYWTLKECKPQKSFSVKMGFLVDAFVYASQSAQENLFDNFLKDLLFSGELAIMRKKWRDCNYLMRTNLPFQEICTTSSVTKILRVLKNSRHSGLYNLCMKLDIMKSNRAMNVISARNTASIEV